MARQSPAPAYRVASEDILDAATAVFAADGYDRSNMDAIATRAGVTKPTLYARFGSKEALFRAAVEREYEVRKARLFNAYEEGGNQPFRERLHRWSSAYFDLVRERPEAFVLITEGERHPGAGGLIRQANQEIVERITELVLQVSGRRGESGARLVASMISGIFIACAREVVLRGIGVAEAAALCESFLYDALRGLDPQLMDAVGTEPAPTAAPG
jgi:AcrR family transcriptional regulator